MRLLQTIVNQELVYTMIAIVTGSAHDFVKVRRLELLKRDNTRHLCNCSVEEVLHCPRRDQPASVVIVALL